MKRRDFLWFAAGILIGTIALSEQSSFGDAAQKVFSAGRGFVAAFADNLAEASPQIGQFVRE